jgi:hypothetical protein
MRIYALIACLALLPVTVLAATRTVCFELSLADDRIRCPVVGTIGAVRPCNPGGTVNAVGHVYELWDKDSDGKDDFLGEFVVGGEGRRCATFTWTQNGNPDVYLKYMNQVSAIGHPERDVIAVETGGGSLPATTWRDGTVSSFDDDDFVAINCAGGSCDILPGSTLVPDFDTTSDRGEWIQALDSAQHTLQIYGSVLDKDVEMHFPGSKPTTSFADGQKDFHIANGDGDEGDTVTHEMGHVLQMQLFSQNSLVNECGGSHSLTSIENESCATTEGFADYVAAVSWYDPNNKFTVPIAFTWDIEEAIPFFATCSTNASIELQVAKAFWDLDDSNDEKGEGAAGTDDDLQSLSTLAIANGWANFPNGSQNHENSESDVDGVNARDYFANNTTVFGFDLFETFLSHNCLETQDTN